MGPRNGDGLRGQDPPGVPGSAQGTGTTLPVVDPGLDGVVGVAGLGQGERRRGPPTETST